MEEQKEYLLSSESHIDDTDDIETGWPAPIRRAGLLDFVKNHVLAERLWFSTYIILLHALLICAALSILSSRRANVRCLKDGIYNSPAKGSISYVISSEHSTDHLKYSAYSGPPSEENNRAWETLIEPTFFGATEQELIEAGESVNDSVKLAAGGYVAALGVYHEIHCLRQLRLFLYSDVYYPNLTQANIKYLQGHLGHCIETLRISVMCQADMSLYTFRWENSTDDRPATKSNAKRQCVNWDPLEKWSQNRKVSLWPVLLRTTGEAEKIHLKD